MLFSLIRIIICAILVLLLGLYVKKRIKNKKLLCLTLILVFAVSLSALSMIPIENSFFQFDSLSQISQYNNSKKILQSAEGQSSAMVISGTESKRTMNFYRKNDSGKYLLCASMDAQRIKYQLCGLYSLIAYHIKDTDDYYIIVSGTSENKLVLSDNKQSDFIVTTHDSTVGIIQYYYSFATAYVNNLSDYEIIIDGESYKIDL